MKTLQENDLLFIINKQKEIIKSYEQRLDEKNKALLYLTRLVLLNKTDTEQPGIYIDERV